ncbi:SDR family oxidoreductase [Pendulispora albinea]|uniref:SDR family oxidoreductase n=1 Tax=Pendulispora albinea TaxID=2741071 RepID=A0ABZ2M6S6_9BACT
MLNGKRVVLLGGTSGIGFAAAEAVQRRGAQVVVVSRRREKVDAAVARLGPGAEGHAADLAVEDDVRDTFERIGAFDHLVYTAGEPLQIGPLEALRLADARRFFEIRFWGAYAAAKYGARGVRPGGSIVFTSGIASRRPWPGWSTAASICGAMESLTRALAVELAPVRVNAICAGVVNTELWSGATSEARAGLVRMAASLPARRIGQPADLGEAYAHLMANGYVTGAIVTIDGGAMLV